MCLINFLYKVHPNYPLILVANRDEAYERPALPAHYWSDKPSILAGRDLQQMGTWLGITKTGRFAALTNYRDPTLTQVGNRSRGEIISRFLETNHTPEEYLHQLHKEHIQYPGFNVLLGNHHALFYYSNIEQKITPLQPGIYGLSNHLLNTPWPKVTKGKRLLQTYCENHTTLDIEEIAALHTDNTIAPDYELPNTGVGLELERILSPLFIQSEKYGTRAITVLLIDHHQQATFLEKTFACGRFTEQQLYQFQIENGTFS